MLTLEKVLELKAKLTDHEKCGFAGPDALGEDLYENAEALLEAAERVARDEAAIDALVADDRAFATAQMEREARAARDKQLEDFDRRAEANGLLLPRQDVEDDATFARNELAAVEWLAEVDAAHPDLHWQNDFATARDIGMADPKAYADADVYGKRAMLDRFKAERRAAELEAECLTEFHMRPCTARGSHSVNPHAFGPEHVEAWYRSRGVIVQVEPGPDPGRLNIKPLRMVR